jgi:hypothetical protein
VLQGYDTDCQDKGQRTSGQVDGTSNGTERAMDWEGKERWRSIRGQARHKSAVNISRLLALCDNHPERGAVALSLVDAQAPSQQPKIGHQSASSHRAPDFEQPRPEP